MALCLLFCCHCAVARNSLALSGFVMSVCLAISRSLSCTVFSVDGFLPFKRISSMYWFIAESVVSGIFWYDVRCTGITSLTCLNVLVISSCLLILFHLSRVLVILFHSIVLRILFLLRFV